MKKDDLVNLFPIETERLVIRTASEKDAPFIQSAKESVDPAILRRWMSWSSDKGMSMQGTADYLEQHSNNDRTIALLAIDKITNEHVLSTGLDAEDDDYQVVSTGWWLSNGHQGKGLAYECMNSLLRMLKDKTDIRTMISSHYLGNERSQNLMKRLGFVYDYTVENGHRSHLDGKDYDVFHYKLDF